MNHKTSSLRKFLLPFLLAFCLVGLAVWLFVPWLFLPQPSTLASETASQAVAELLPASEPDHVFFAPRAHSRDACNECHTFSDEEYMHLFKLNKQTEPEDPEQAAQIFYQSVPMSMAECLACHAVPAHLNTTTASESCGTCHR